MNMKLYFGNTVTTVTTIMILVLLGFIGESIANRTNINYWGRRSLFLLAYGLGICCFVAARDGLDKTIQYTIDGSCAPGVFSLISIPNLIGCVGAVIIIIAAIATPIAKSQHVRQIWFYVMSGGMAGNFMLLFWQGASEKMAIWTYLLNHSSSFILRMPGWCWNKAQRIRVM